MKEINEFLQKSDWKTEKHAPVIEVPASVAKDQPFTIRASVGKQIPHPNTTEHHISWIEVYFHPDGEKFPAMVGRFEFSSHGASPEGPNKGSVYTSPDVQITLKTAKPGTVMAMSYCNIHGLWSSSAAVDLK